MSLFGSFMGDFDDDPFFGSHMRQMRQMNAMMDQMFSGGPFGGLLGMGGMGMGGMGMGGMAGAPPALTAPQGLRHHPGAAAAQELVPFGAFPSINVNRMFQGLEDVGAGGHSYSSSTVMTMSSGPDGRPQLYRASASTRTGPGGVTETKKTVCDSRSGIKKMAIGHHIGERAHVLEREHNLHSGDREERHEFINLDEEEADDFNREFERRTRHAQGGGGGGGAAAVAPHAHSAAPHGGGHRPREPQLALPCYSRPGSAGGATATARGSPSPGAARQHHQGATAGRKRDHEGGEADPSRRHKSLKPSHHQQRHQHPGSQ